MRRQRRPAAPVLGADVGLEARDRHVAPVGVVGRRQDLRLVVALGLHGLGHQRVLAVGADHHASALGHGRAALGVAADAGDGAVVHHDLLDGERLAHLHPGLDRGLDQQRVEHRPPRTVGVRRAVGRSRGARDRERAEVERVRRDRRATGGLEPLEQSPPGERGHSGRVDEVRRHRVARERRLVDHQHPMALARQQHRGGRPSTARADDDRIPRLGHVRLSLSSTMR